MYTLVTSLHLVCTCNLSHCDLCTLGNVPKSKIFGVFLILSRITWPLAFHMPGNTPTRPSTSYWRAIYWAPWIHWRRRIEERKETIVHLCLIHTCLSLHPFVLVSTHLCSSQDYHCLVRFPLRWRIEVAEAQVEDSISPFQQGANWRLSLVSFNHNK